MNYFVIHVASNTIYKVIASSQVPTDTETIKFIPASEGRVNQYLEREKWGKPVNLYSIVPKPKLAEIMPLTIAGRSELKEYVLKNRHRETVERMAWVWRVSERTIREILTNHPHTLGYPTGGGGGAAPDTPVSLGAKEAVGSI